MCILAADGQSGNDQKHAVMETTYEDRKINMMSSLPHLYPVLPSKIDVETKVLHPYESVTGRSMDPSSSPSTRMVAPASNQILFFPHDLGTGNRLKSHHQDPRCGYADTDYDLSSGADLPSWNKQTVALLFNGVNVP